MAAAAGTALLRYMATKMGMTVAPRAPWFRHPGLRGRRPFSSSSSPSGSTPPPTNNKDLSQNKNVRCESDSAKATYTPVAPKVAYFPYFLLFGTMGYMYWYMLPKLEELSNQMAILSRVNSILFKALQECQTTTHIEAKDVLADSSQSRSMQSLGQGNKEGDDGQQAS